VKELRVTAVSSATANDALCFCIIGQSDVLLWSVHPADRIRKQLAQAGVTREIAESRIDQVNGTVILVGADAVIDQPLIAVLVTGPDFILRESPGNGIVAARVAAHIAVKTSDVLRESVAPETSGLTIKSPEDVDVKFWKALRKRETPYAMRVTEKNKSQVEWRMFMGTYKGATDIVTKHVWPLPAFYATRWLAGLGVKPNAVTSIAAIATVLTFYLFLQGYFAWGLVSAWTMTYLDTVDGKLARTTLTSSKWGDIFDHGIDLVHPPFWYAAWAIGVEKAGIPWTGHMFWLLMGIILGGYVVQRLMEGVAIKGLGLEIHIWRRIDTYFRQITARRNPNLLILTLFALIARPDLGLIVVAAWTAICLVLHGIQLAQAFATKSKSGSVGLQSWMSKP
jgi:phosphatidylglycerophosphate synthase